MTAFADAALNLASRGFHVFPSRPGTNLPAVKRWPEVATVDPDQVSAWWRRWPRANVSNCTGRTGVVVIDLDGPAGIDSWRALQRRHGAVPDTLAVISPRAEGGIHLYFTAPGFYVRSTASQLGPGIDVRGTRGQAVLPPSVRPDGVYRWANPDLPVARPPGWLVELLRPPPPPPRRPLVGSTSSGRLDGLARTVATAEQGSRNATLHWAACRGAEMVAAGADRAQVAGRLLDAALAAGLDHREATATIRSGMATAGVAA